MASKKADMQRLLNQRDQLMREIEALRNKVAGLEMAIALLDADDGAGAKRSGRKPSERRSVKTVLLDLLEESGTTGLNASSAVEIANRRGITLGRGTVSSLLSRIKRDGVITFDGERYRLKKYTVAEKGPGDDRDRFRVISTGE